jgi:dTDP-L-rhamnose 4-epimerase
VSRYLVTGGAGFIGSHTVDHLLADGHEVRVLDSLQPRVHPLGKPSYLSAQVDFIQGDVADEAALRPALEGIDGVFHLAAYQDYLPDFSTFIHTNAESSALLFELVARDDLPIRKIVFASSQSVSGEGTYLCAEHGVTEPGPRSLAQLRAGEWELRCPECGAAMTPVPIPEETVRPHTAYAISKYAIELLAASLGGRYGVATACMRYTYVQGPRNSFFNAYSGIARRFALRLMHDLPPVCYEDGRQLRDYVNVADVARANLLVMADDRADGGVFNVGGGRAVTVAEFAGIISAEFGSDLGPAIPGEFRVGDTRHTVSDISRIQALGWQPQVPVEASMTEYVAWIRDQVGTRAYLDEAEQVMRESGVVQQVAGKA